MLERPDRPPLRFRSMLAHSILGETDFYRRIPRGATVIADEPTVLYRMNRHAYDRMTAEAPLVAAAFDRFIIRILADRLTMANMDKAALAL